MSIEIAKANYPSFNADAGVSGKRIVAYVSYGSDGSPATKEAPVWNLVGGVTSITQSLSTNTSDANTRDQKYWSESIVVSKQLTISMDLILKRGSVGQQVLDFFCYDDDTTAEKQALDLAIVDLDTKEYTRMQAVPSSWEMTADSEDFVQYSLSATCTGQPTKEKNFVIPA